VTRQLVGRYASRIRPTQTTPDETALTPRELEVLRLIADGRSNSEIADTSPAAYRRRMEASGGYSPCR
jgi:DNA-binding NarL/FixJ family response regulator